MKHFICSTLLCLCVLVAQAQYRPFDRFKNMDGVTSVYVTKDLLGMMDNNKIEGIKLNGIANKLKSVCVMTSRKKSIKERMRNESRLLTRRNGYEPLAQVNDKHEHVAIFRRKLTCGLHEYVVMADEKKECTVIIVTGRLTQKDLKHVLTR